MLGAFWLWRSGSTHPAHSLATAAAATTVVATAPPSALPPTSYDVSFGYHQTAIVTNETLSSAFEAWHAANARQCGTACSCQTGARIEVVGHADRRTGTRRFNKCISWKRATVVADALVDRGVPRCDVVAGFVGDSDTPSPEPDEASAARHRHATITILAGNRPSVPSCVGACQSTLGPSDAERCEALLKQPPLRKGLQ